LPLNSGQSYSDNDFYELRVRYLHGEDHSWDEIDDAIVKLVGLEIEIGWSELERKPYVAKFAVELDNAPVAAIVSPPQAGRAQLTDFNFAHPLLQRPTVAPEERAEIEAGQVMSSPLQDEIWSLAREAAADRSTADTPDDKLRIA